MMMRSTLLPALTLALLAACTTGEDPQLGEVTANLDEVDAGGAGVLGDVVWEWNHLVNGNNPISMGSALNRTCHLQGVAGNFDGSGEKVYVYIKNGAWWLGGESPSPTKFLYAAARCVDLLSTPESTWVESIGPVAMQPTATHSCMLEEIQGAFHTWHEWVGADGGGATWMLGGEQNTGNGLGAKARCVARPRLDPEYVWNDGDQPVTMMPVSTHVCYLTRVAGYFNGSGEWFLIAPSTPGGHGYWILKGGNSANPLQAQARCFAR